MNILIHNSITYLTLYGTVYLTVSEIGPVRGKLIGQGCFALSSLKICQDNFTIKFMVKIIIKSE